MTISSAIKLFALLSFLLVSQSACQFTAGARTAQQLLNTKNSNTRAINNPTSTKPLASKTTPASDAFEAQVAKQ